MGKLRTTLLDRLAHRRGLKRWSRAAKESGTMPLSQLRVERGQARKLRSHLDNLIYVADNRLALPAIGSNAFPTPHGTTWSWRPVVWRGPLQAPGKSSVESKHRLGEEVTLFHDCQQSELTLRQLRNHREEDLAPFGLRLDVFNFDGSFLSLVIDLPTEATDGLQRRHLIRVDSIVEVEKPIEIFARLNIKHGPNTEQIVRELPLQQDEIMVEFDLAYSRLNEKRVERAWLDLIFENPQMNQITLRDLTFSRRARAEL